MGDVHLVLNRGEQLGHVLRKATITGDGEDGAVWRRRPSADRRRVAEANRPQIAGHEHGLAGPRLEVASERVGVVAHIDSDHCSLGDLPTERREYGGRVDTPTTVVDRKSTRLNSS